MVYYFAYGSNLNTEQFARRIGKWSSAQNARLIGYKLVFDCDSSFWKGKTANIRKTRNKEDVVYGAVYEITKEQLDILTSEYEKIAPSLVSVSGEDNREIEAETYIFRKGREGNPPRKYLETLIKGLRQHKITARSKLNLKI